MKKQLVDRLVESMEQHNEFDRSVRAHSREKRVDAVGTHAALRLSEDEEKLREIRHRELKAAIQEGIDSQDTGSVEEVVARNRERRASRKASKK